MASSRTGRCLPHSLRAVQWRRNDRCTARELVNRKDGKIVAARLFEETEKFEGLDPPAAVAAFDKAFARLTKGIISWTVQTL